MKTSLEISPTQLLYVTKQNLYKKCSSTRKAFLHKSAIWLETYKIGKKLSLTHLKLEAFNNLKILSCTPQTSTLKLSTTWTFFHTFSNLNIETFNNLKNILPHFNTYNTLKKSLPHLPLTWKSCKLFVCHHLEMNSHSYSKLKNLFSKGFSLFFYAIQAQNPSLLLVLTQCPFSCLVWAHNLLQTTWKQARNERFKVHEMEQLY